MELETLIRFSLLRTRLKDEKLSRLFDDIFEGLKVRSPKREFSLNVNPSYAFREWDLEAPRGSPLLLVDWPQHPVRPPLKSADMWRAACDQFAAQLRDRDPSLID